MYSTGVPPLHKLQARKKEAKRAKTAGLQISTLLQLKTHLLKLKMPESLSALTIPAASDALVAGGAAGGGSLVSSKVIWVPQDPVYDTEGACLTGGVQIQWIGQLAKRPWTFVLHCDGKHKLHHGDWILLTCGTHILHWDEHNSTLSHKFVPLMYLLCKQHESNGACQMLTDALNMTWCVPIQASCVLLLYCSCIADVSLERVCVSRLRPATLASLLTA